MIHFIYFALIWKKESVVETLNAVKKLDFIAPTQQIGFLF